MSEKLTKLVNDISLLEKNSRSQGVETITDNLILWGSFVQKLRALHLEIPKQDLIDNSIRLSKLLSVLITEIGICNDYAPLPEMVSQLKHNKSFDIVEADPNTALVYCTHKTIECLAIIASLQKN